MRRVWMSRWREPAGAEQPRVEHPWVDTSRSRSRPAVAGMLGHVRLLLPPTSRALRGRRPRHVQASVAGEPEAKVEEQNGKTKPDADHPMPDDTKPEQTESGDVDAKMAEERGGGMALCISHSLEERRWAHTPPSLSLFLRQVRGWNWGVSQPLFSLLAVKEWGDGLTLPHLFSPRCQGVVRCAPTPPSSAQPAL